MSRFQIRKRLRGILSGSKKPKYQTYTVTYILPDGTEKRVEAEERYNLLPLAQVGEPAERAQMENAPYVALKSKT